MHILHGLHQQTKKSKRGMEEEMVKVGILGYGTVGSGVFEILNKNSDIITKRAGQDIEVKYVLDLRDFPGDPVENYVVQYLKMMMK